MGRHFFGLDLVVKLHGVGKTFLYLNVSVSMVDGALLLFESDGRSIIRICCTPNPQVPWSSDRRAFVFGVRWFFTNIFD